MASNSHDRGPSDENDIADHSIPLQNLSGSQGRGRGISGVGSRLFSGRSLTERGRTYERLTEESPVERGGSHTGARSDDAANQFNVEDPGAFAAAMSSVGLGFEATDFHPSPPSASPLPGHSRDPSMSDMDFVQIDTVDAQEANHYLSPSETYPDTTPLTSIQHVQPISGSSIAPSASVSRDPSPSVRFDDGQMGSRLGDDLHNIETGYSGRRRGESVSRDGSRSLSPSVSGSALHRASSMMKSVSQRVVNLSNEPEVVENSLTRESHKSSRMEAPPSLPSLPDYAHDAPSTPSLSEEPSGEKPMDSKAWKQFSNPLRGKALGFLSPESVVRTTLCDILVHPFTEPFILVIIVVQTILLTIESAESEWSRPRSPGWGGNNLDYAYLVIFLIYTVELIAKIMVSGFFFNPVEYSTIDRSKGLMTALVEKGQNLITPQRQFSTRKSSAQPVPQQPSILRTFTGGLNQLENQMEQQLAGDPLQKRRIRLAHRAFLRHSFNRLDFVAVVAYWASFVLSIAGVENSHQLYVFRMLSCLRILRLLALTSGTSVILRSLKKAAPLLVHVAFLIGFFWLLFAIVGIQSFKSSFRRKCVWIGTDGQDNFTMNDPSDTLQLCGGWLNETGHQRSWIDVHNNEMLNTKPKGYICPKGSMCIEGDNPYNKTVSFDNIFNSLELVFVIMSSNTFTDLLYYMTDSDYLIAALFFACGLVILSLWMVNLLVAVITHSFQVIREESKRSAFASQNIEATDQEDETSRKTSSLKRIYDATYWFWIAVIIFDLIIQALRSSTMGDDRKQLINVSEIIVTIVLLGEIILRFIVDWRKFHKSRRNWFDLTLAIITCVIQIPAIKNSGRAYDVLTLFQILRVYRVVLAFSVTRNLITLVFRNALGLINLILFLFLITFLASIFATQLFRSQIPREDDGGEMIATSFADIYNSFLGMYQVLSSENWTEILYNVTSYTYSFNTSWISATFMILWFVVANFIVLNMFIAVIQESFDVSEDEKRLHQVRAFLKEKQVTAASQGNLSLSKIFKFKRGSARFEDPLDYGPAALGMLLEDAVVEEFLDEMPSENQPRYEPSIERTATATEGLVQPGIFSRAWTRITSSIMRREPNPFYSKLEISRAYEELAPGDIAKEVVSAAKRRKQAQREYLVRHPTYNTSMFLFKPDNPIRRLCQRMVGPGRGGERVEGVDPWKPVWYSFSAFIYAAIVAMVILACITTPIYQARNFTTDRDWFTYTDLGFAILFSIEALIKVIADGFFWTPNAYFRGSWGFIDGIVLITLWISVLSALVPGRAITSGIGAFKALRALRLLNFSDSAKDTFHSVIILGGWKVIAAAAVSMSFLIPFAIYGVTLFHGQMVECNDGDISGSLDACIGEFMDSPYNWDVLAPRAASNPYYDFDNFGNSLFILFQIVSQEGWTDVQASAMSIKGVGQQPEDYAAPENGLFFVVFNLLGAVFVLTLFVSVFMRNYTEQTGVAFLTAEQRSWLELRKLLRQVSPSKRRSTDKSTTWKQWAYRVAYKKHGRWAKCVTTVLAFHLLLLILEWYPEPTWWEITRDILFFAFNFVYLANVLLRMAGLGWHRFSRSSWDMYAFLVVPCTIITSVLNFISAEQQVISVMNKLFLVAITLLLIPRNNQLDQLFKTAAASFGSIGNLLATWFVMFLVYAIAMNQAFGLTKFGSNETNNVNFRDIPRALILLFRTSCGEGWNELMEDFAQMKFPYCDEGDDGDGFFRNDCGSRPWARALFISWNIISMYIFVSLFVSLIFESFSYVYQRSSGLYVISREELRRFKQAWAEFDPEGSGYISKEQFPRLLGELTGKFEVRIYQGDFMIPRILDECRVDKRDSLLAHRRVYEGVDLDKLAKAVRKIPVENVRKRRKRLNELYEEVLVSADPVHGISFHTLLMILAHHNVISDNKSLRLEEFLRRRAKLQRVEEAVRRNTVIGFFKTLTAAREFRRRIDHKRSARMTFVPQFNVPEIYVDEEPQGSGQVPEPSGYRTPTTEEPGESSMLSPASTGRTGAAPSLPRINTNVGGLLNSEASSPSEWSNISISLSPGRERAHTTSSYDPGPERGPTSATSEHSRHNSAVAVQGMMQSLGDSAWGESIRRSFTQRRPRDET
ncbi:Ion transport protein-domain-containing protein [Aspergillus unguis]